MIVLKWKDNWSVCILSNYLDPKDVESVTRRGRTGEIVKAPCPHAVKDYNNHMNFVDKFDQLKGNYAIDRKSHKCWHRVFFLFLDGVVVNAFVIYRELRSTSGLEFCKLILKVFRLSVYQGLIAPLSVKNRRPESVTAALDHHLSVLLSLHKPIVPRKSAFKVVSISLSEAHQGAARVVWKIPQYVQFGNIALVKSRYACVKGRHASKIFTANRLLMIFNVILTIFNFR